jgi:anti-sigma regulatory factor (Ser/Thr protein kinase)
MHGAPASRIALAAALEEAACRLSVTDNGPAFDPASAPLARDAASLDQDSPGGLGLLLLRRYGRDLAWRRLPEGNRLEVTVPLA